MKLSEDAEFLAMMNSFLITSQGLKAVDEVLAKLSSLEQDNELLSDLKHFLEHESLWRQLFKRMQEAWCYAIKGLEQEDFAQQNHKEIDELRRKLGLGEE